MPPLTEEAALRGPAPARFGLHGDVPGLVSVTYSNLPFMQDCELLHSSKVNSSAYLCSSAWHPLLGRDLVPVGQLVKPLKQCAVRPRVQLLGQKRRFEPLPATSGLPRSTDIVGPTRLVRFVPEADLRRRAARLLNRNSRPRPAGRCAGEIHSAAGAPPFDGLAVQNSGGLHAASPARTPQATIDWKP